MNIIRVRQDGSLCIPAALRNRYGIQPGSLMSVAMDKYHRVILKPEKYICSGCHGEIKRVDRVTGLCTECQVEMTRLIREGMNMPTAIAEMRKKRR